MKRIRREPPALFKEQNHQCSCGNVHTIRPINPAWLQWHRQRCGYSLRDLGRKLGVSAQYLCDIEHGRRRCTPEVESGYRGCSP